MSLGERYSPAYKPERDHESDSEMHNRLVDGSIPSRPTIISSTEEVEFLFCLNCACLLYMLADLLMGVRFELWGDH